MLWGRDIEVLVAGAGPTGLFSAVALAEKGLRVGVVDEAPGPSQRSHALLLHPRTLELFDDLGLMAPLLGHTTPLRQVGLYRELARKAEVSFDTLSQRFPFALPVEYRRLTRVLEERLAARGVTVTRRHRFAGLEQAINAVHVTLDRLAPYASGYGGARAEWTVEQTLSSKVPFLLAAGGTRSLARSRLGIGFKAFAPTQYFAVFEFESDCEPLEEIRVDYSHGAETVVWPLGEGRWRLTAEVDPETFPPSRMELPLVLMVDGETFRPLGREILEHLIDHRAPWLKGRIGRVSWSTIVRFERRFADNFGRGRVFIAGDAAHVLSPALCWSVNLGLQEGADLAGRLQGVLRRGVPFVTLDEFSGRWNALGAHFVESAHLAPERSLQLGAALE